MCGVCVCLGFCECMRYIICCFCCGVCTSVACVCVLTLLRVCCTMIPGNGIGAEGVKALVPALQQLSHLTTLNLWSE